MPPTLADLAGWMAAPEDEHLEFKEAKSRFEFDLLVKYCAALANERGGRMILGVTDRWPRRVVGTEAFENVNRLKAGLMERIPLRVDVYELAHADGRVLVVDVPSRHLGTPIGVNGAFYMRRGEDLVPMTLDMIRRIGDEAGPDFSAQVCERATLADLDAGAVEAFRTRLRRPSRADARAREPVEQTLADAELTVDGGVTYAALALFGTRQALGRYLAQAEVVFEYRSSEASGPASQREEFREGFFLFQDRLWNLVDLRNDQQSFQDGFFMPGVPTFNEVAVREAVANAVIHRDYRSQNSVFVRQYARRLETVSPGGLPSGVTLENILWAQAPRNRRLAEALGRCDVVERSGQGVNRMFEESIKEGKA